MRPRKPRKPRGTRGTREGRPRKDTVATGNTEKTEMPDRHGEHGNWSRQGREREHWNTKSRTMVGTRLYEVAIQFPELEPITASYLGGGCDSVALLINETWVFRFPRTAEVEAQLAVESALLSRLAPLLPLDVPRFEFHGRPGAHFPRRFVGYRKISGTPAIGTDPGDLDPAEVERLGQFLARLHDTPLDLARACGVPDEPLGRVLGELRDDALRALVEVRKAAPAAPYDRWRALLEDPPRRPDAAPVLAHNDLAAEHVLLDPEARRVTGVIDWSDAAITAPEVDFAGFWHWGGEALATAMLRAYESAGARLCVGALEMSRYLGACRGAMDVAFGVEMQRPEYVTAGLRALHLCDRDHEPR